MEAEVGMMAYDNTARKMRKDNVHNYKGRRNLELASIPYGEPFNMATQYRVLLEQTKSR